MELPQSLSPSPQHEKHQYHQEDTPKDPILESFYQAQDSIDHNDHGQDISLQNCLQNKKNTQRWTINSTLKDINTDVYTVEVKDENRNENVQSNEKSNEKDPSFSRDSSQVFCFQEFKFQNQYKQVERAPPQSLLASKPHLNSLSLSLSKPDRQHRKIPMSTCNRDGVLQKEEEAKTEVET